MIDIPIYFPILVNSTNYFNKHLTESERLFYNLRHEWWIWCIIKSRENMTIATGLELGDLIYGIRL